IILYIFVCIIIILIFFSNKKYNILSNLIILNLFYCCIVLYYISIYFIQWYLHINQIIIISNNTMYGIHYKMLLFIISFIILISIVLFFYLIYLYIIFSLFHRTYHHHYIFKINITYKLFNLNYINIFYIQWNYFQIKNKLFYFHLLVVIINIIVYILFCVQF